MNEKFFVNGRCYKTPCITVLTADEFTVKLFTCKHTITASITEKCYFVSIDNIGLSDIKCDFHFSRNYTKPKEFLSNLYDTLDSFISTTLPFLENLLGVKRPVHRNTDEILDILLENVIATELEASDSDPEVGQFVYDVVMHNFYGWDTYTVRADRLESAVNKALKRYETENYDVEYPIDSIRIYKENSNVLLKEIICEPTETEPETATEDTTDQDETTEPEILKPLEIIFDDENSKPEIRTKFYLLETFNRLNINHYYVELMTDKKIGDFYLYLKFDENGNEEKAMCKIFHINAEYRNNAFEMRFLYALAEKYNGLYCTPDYDDFALYSEIAEECKTPETFEPFIASGEKCFFISSDKNNERNETVIDNFNKKSVINSMYGITANSPEIYNEYNETKEQLAVEQFERLTRTLFKSLFKAIGLEETRRIPIIISNNMVFFNYNGMQYKYNPSQCKVYKKDGRKYQRINWKDFTDDNSPTDQKQARERSPPLLLI